MAEEQDLLEEDRAGGWDVVLLNCSVHVYDKVRSEVRHRARRARRARQEAEVGNLFRTSYDGNPLPDGPYRVSQLRQVLRGVLYRDYVFCPVEYLAQKRPCKVHL